MQGYEYSEVAFLQVLWISIFKKYPGNILLFTFKKIAGPERVACIQLDIILSKPKPVETSGHSRGKIYVHNNLWTQ